MKKNLVLGMLCALFAVLLAACGSTTVEATGTTGEEPLPMVQEEEEAVETTEEEESTETPLPSVEEEPTTTPAPAGIGMYQHRIGDVTISTRTNIDQYIEGDVFKYVELMESLGYRQSGWGFAFADGQGNDVCVNFNENRQDVTLNLGVNYSDERDSTWFAFVVPYDTGDYYENWGGCEVSRSQVALLVYYAENVRSAGDYSKQMFDGLSDYVSGETNRGGGYVFMLPVED